MLRTVAKPLISATGNNLVVKGDLTRRSMVGRLDPKCERPELREFAYDPIVKPGGIAPSSSSRSSPPCGPIMPLVMPSRTTVSAAAAKATIATPEPGTLGYFRSFAHPTLRDALLVVSGRGGTIDTRLMGRWLKHVGPRCRPRPR
jgi:hypothetical protein